MNDSHSTDPAIYGRPQHDVDEGVRPAELYGDAQHENCAPFGPVSRTDFSN